MLYTLIWTAAICLPLFIQSVLSHGLALKMVGKPVTRFHRFNSVTGNTHNEPHGRLNYCESLHNGDGLLLNKPPDPYQHLEKFIVGRVRPSHRNSQEKTDDYIEGFLFYAAPPPGRAERPEDACAGVPVLYLKAAKPEWPKDKNEERDLTDYVEFTPVDWNGIYIGYYKVVYRDERDLEIHNIEKYSRNDAGYRQMRERHNGAKFVKYVKLNKNNNRPELEGIVRLKMMRPLRDFAERLGILPQEAAQRSVLSWPEYQTGTARLTAPVFNQLQEAVQQPETNHQGQQLQPGIINYLPNLNPFLIPSLGPLPMQQSREPVNFNAPAYLSNPNNINPAQPLAQPNAQADASILGVSIAQPEQNIREQQQPAPLQMPQNMLNLLIPGPQDAQSNTIIQDLLQNNNQPLRATYQEIPNFQQAQIQPQLQAQPEPEILDITNPKYWANLHNYAADAQNQAAIIESFFNDGWNDQPNREPYVPINTGIKLDWETSLRIIAQKLANDPDKEGWKWVDLNDDRQVQDNWVTQSKLDDLARSHQEDLWRQQQKDDFMRDEQEEGQ